MRKNHLRRGKIHQGYKAIKSIEREFNIIEEEILMKQNNKVKITEDITLAEILKMPGSEAILAKYNLPCLSCPMAKFEMEKLKLGDVCKMYGIDLENLLRELNPVRKSPGSGND